ncbi:histone H1-like [Conger conger]|uniref:histone H1-like n=1 Tax=Conger conger TaxID=82655 RepID=UPI002A59C2F2|nr:histone H1-like [Conger conger]
MSSLTPLPPAPKKARRRSSKTKRPGPTVSDLIVKAVSASKERSGVSLIAIKKALSAGSYDVVKNKVRVNMAIRRLVTKGVLIQTKGTGASGSFKTNKKQVVAKKKTPAKKKKPATKAKKPATKKRKRPASKKTAGPKKSPKKAKKKPAVAKKAKSPSKAKKPRAKKPRTPKAARPKVAKRKTTRAKAVAQ